ncbi:MAG: hypothetical protein JSU09_10085 [Bacteroidetes bacterium]|nr:hypothetical protein [Bacteroidota bacterium]
MRAIKSKKFVGNKKVFTLSPQTLRLLEITDILRANKTIESDADLCRFLFYSPQSFNQIRKGRRNATVELITMFCFRFHVNANYIVLGLEPKLNFKDTVKSKIAKASGSEESLISCIKEELKSSGYLQVFLSKRFWHERISFLAETIKSLEAKNIAQLYEIKTLKKLITDNLIVSKPMEHN